MDNVVVHSRISERHPEISPEDVLHAWRNAIVVVERRGVDAKGPIFVGVGPDGKGRMLEMVCAVLPDESVCIFHALTPPTRKILREAGMMR